MIKIHWLEISLYISFYAFFRLNETDFHAPELLTQTARHIYTELKIMDIVPHVRISKIK